MMEIVRHRTAIHELHPLSLHDALPISKAVALKIAASEDFKDRQARTLEGARILAERDRKSTRLNSSHVAISYAVFCLKKKKIKIFANTDGEANTTEIYSQATRNY